MNTEFYPLHISKLERLTKDSVALTLDLPPHLVETFRYIQGQHLTLRAMIDDQDVRRSYSICQGVNEQQLQVGIKAIPAGVFSNYANHQLKVGMALDVMPPQGHFYTQLDPDHQKHYLFIAVGSGITPNLSHIRSILATEPQSIVTLIYGNKSTALMMFREDLSFIKNQYLSRFQQINLFTREENEASLFNGRISPEKILALHHAKLIDIGSLSDVFICGPEALINQLVFTFKHWQFSEEQLHYELFFAGADQTQVAEGQARRAAKFGETISTVAVNVAGRKTFIDLLASGDSILDAAMENGADLPFSCKGGVCATCKAKVVKGEVEMDLNHSLTQQEVADGYILTCQAHPISEQVEIDFDL